MNLDKVNERLASFQKPQQREKVDYSTIFWKPELGKQTIRIVPSKYDPDMPFSELKFHYDVGKYPMVALSNFGKQDPVEEFCKELRKTDDRDNWSLAGRLSPKTRVFAPIVVRGEEDKGVRLWGFGKQIYEELLKLAKDEDVGDYTDVINGWDLVVEKEEGNPYPKTTVRIKPKQSPLSDNNNQVENWLKEQPNALESFTQYDYDFIKKQLNERINGGSSEQAPVADPNIDTSLPESLGQHKTEFTLENATEGKKDTVGLFDELFDK